MKAKKLLIDLLELDADTQSRVALNHEKIAEYAAAMEEGEEFPPIDVFSDGASYYIADGWHRAHAWLKVGLANIPVTMHDGGFRAAKLFSFGANDKHGLARTNADKRHAVLSMLQDPEGEWSEWSDARIAEVCKVARSFVQKVRAEVATMATSEEPEEEDEVERSDGEPLPVEPPKPATRIGKDGKRYPVKEKPATPKGPSIPTLALPYQRATNDLLRISRDMKEISETPAGAHLASKITRVVKSIEEAKQAIRQAEPMALCGKCNGDGCQHCARTGFWTRMTVESKSK